MSRLVIFAPPLPLSGCVVALGDAYQIELKTPEAIVIHYDSNVIDDNKIEGFARDHCHTYGKTALLTSHEVNLMNISTDNFLCKNPVPNTVVAPQ